MKWPKGANDRLDALIIVQGNLCAGCGKPMLPRSDYPTRRGDARYRDLPSADHVIPQSKGGRRGLGNLIAMHKLCNETKGDDMPTGCEMIWLLAVNTRLGVRPQRW